MGMADSWREMVLPDEWPRAGLRTLPYEFQFLSRTPFHFFSHHDRHSLSSRI